jgi:sugar lactone lactonase YvrE
MRHPKIRKRLRPVRLRTHLRLESLEERIYPAVQLTYGGTGTVLLLRELEGGTTPQVAVSESSTNMLRIDLGASTFDAASITSAIGLTYENVNSPQTSHYATVDITLANTISTLQTDLGGDILTLGPIANVTGGLSNLAASAGLMVVNSLDMSQAGVGDASIDLKAAGSITVTQGSDVDSGSGILSLAAGVNSDGTPYVPTIQNLLDFDFETPSLGTGANAYEYDPTNTPWTFQGTSGVSGNGSSFTYLNSNAPEGVQVGFIQINGQVDQSADLPAGTYRVSFQAAERQALQVSSQTIQVLVDGVAVGSPIQPSGTSYQTYSSDLFSVPAGNHVISLVGVNPNGGDNTAFIDSVSVVDQSGLLSVASSAVVTSSNTGANAITLRGDDVDIDTTAGAPAVIGGSRVVGGPPIATLSGPTNVAAQAFDSRGNLIVADSTGNTVYVFTPGSTVPTATLTGFSDPVAIAVDANDNVYVSNRGGNTVDVLAAGTYETLRILTGLDNPTAIAVDPTGNVFVANTQFGDGSSIISKFAPGSTTSTATLTDVSLPMALVCDASGNLYVAAQGVFGGNPVLIYSPGATTPTSFLNGSFSANNLVLDKSGNIYVSSSDGGVYFYPAGSTNSTRTLTGVTTPGSMAFDQYGDLYVADDGSISIYAPGSDSPFSTIAGIVGPTALLFDPRGFLFASSQGQSVVFGTVPKAGGVVIETASPLQDITTGLHPTPDGLTLTNDELARLFVVPGGTITLGGANQGGNITFEDTIINNPQVNVVAVQSPTSSGTIFSNASGGLSVLAGSLRMSAGRGGILNVGDDDTLTFYASGPVVLDATGPIGTSVAPVSVDSDGAPIALTVGTTNAPSGGVYISAIGALILSDVQTDNAPIVITASAPLTVESGAIIDAGSGTILLEAGTGPVQSGQGLLTLTPGSAVVSSSTDNDAITLIATDLSIALGADPATVGLNRGVGTSPVPVAGGVVITAEHGVDRINVGNVGGTEPGLTITPEELAQIFTIASGTITFGDANFGGMITLASTNPATTPGAGVTVLESPTGPGSIVLDSSLGTALDTGTGPIVLSAGTGGIVATGAGATLETTGTVSLGASGPIGSAGSRILFDAGATPLSVTAAASGTAAGGVYLGGLASLALAGATTANGTIDVTSVADLTIGPDATIDAGTAKISLAAGTGPDGRPSASGGALSIGGGAVVAAGNIDADAITLRATNITIGTGSSPAIIGARPAASGSPPTSVAGGVVVTTSQANGSIDVGDATGTGINLSNAELAQIFTIPDGTITFGDSTQAGVITFANATPATTPGANVAAIQSPTGPGSIVLDSAGGAALTAVTGGIQLAAGTGGIVATGALASLSTTGSVRLDTTGAIGSGTGRLLFDASSIPGSLKIGSNFLPAGGVYLGGLGALTLYDIHTANSTLDVTAAGNLQVAAGGTIDTANGKIRLVAGANPDGTSSGGGVLSIAGGADLISTNSSLDAITLLGTATRIVGGATPAVIGARPSPPSTTPTSSLTGLNNPGAIATDSGGNVYVADFTDDVVRVYAPGSNTPSRTLTGLSQPTAMVLDASGTLYVANGGGTTISVFSPNATTPSRTLTGLSAPYSLVFDSKGNLYAGNLAANTVSVFAPGSTTPTHTRTGVSLPLGLAIDSNDNLYVTNTNSTTISVFAPDGTPKATLTGANGPGSLAFDGQGNLYVANQGLNGDGTTVSVYAPGSTTPTRTLTGLSLPSVVLVDSQGTLYVLNELGTSVSVFAPGSNTLLRTLTGLTQPTAMALDASGNVYVNGGSNNTVSVFSSPAPTPTAGGVILGTSQPGDPISLGAISGDGLIIGNDELEQLYVIAGGAVTIGGANNTGNILVTGPVTRHRGYKTLILQTENGTINSSGGAVIAANDLALVAGTGIGTTGAISLDVATMAFSSQSGGIQLSDASPITLGSVGPLSTSSIPDNIFSAPQVGDSYTILHSGGVTGEISFSGRALAEGNSITLADGFRYRISYVGNDGHDVTLTRVASLESTGPNTGQTGKTSGSPGGDTQSNPGPAPAVTLVGKTLYITGSPGSDNITLIRHGEKLRVYASFLPAGIPFLAFKLSDVGKVVMQLEAGNDFAKVTSSVTVPVVINGGSGDDVLVAGSARDVLIGGDGTDVLISRKARRAGSLLIGGRTVFDNNDQTLIAILAEWNSGRTLKTRIANLTNGTGDRRRNNGSTLLNSTTVIDDNLRDTILDNSRVDAVFSDSNDIVFDRNSHKSVRDRSHPDTES